VVNRWRPDVFNAVRQAPKLRRLCDEPWPDDLQWTHRAVDGSGEGVLFDSAPSFDGIEWLQDDDGRYEYIDVEYDSSNCGNSLENREDCPKCKDGTTDEVLVMQGNIICTHCKIPLSRHENEQPKIDRNKCAHRDSKKCCLDGCDVCRNYMEERHQPEKRQDPVLG